MKKLMIVSAAAAALLAIAVSAPANAAERKADGVRNGKAVETTDLSARRYRRYGGGRYYGRGYGYYGNPYPYGYYPYGYYRRGPGIYFGFY
jgi:hypothetical protein